MSMQARNDSGRRQPSVLRENLMPLPLSPPSIPHGLSWDQSQAFTVREWQLTVNDLDYNNLVFDCNVLASSPVLTEVLLCCAALRYVAAMLSYLYLPFAVCSRQLLLWQWNSNPSWPSPLQPTYSICHKLCLCVCQNTLWVSMSEVTVKVTLCSIPDRIAVALATHPPTFCIKKP
jgi:hypothetical protein